MAKRKKINMRGCPHCGNANYGTRRTCRICGHSLVGGPKLANPSETRFLKVGTAKRGSVDSMSESAFRRFLRNLGNA